MDWEERTAPCQEVAQVDELAVPLVFDIDDTPAIFTSSNCLTINDHVALGPDNGEWNHVLIS